VRAPLVPEVLRQCVQKGVKAAAILSAGFAETGEAGIKLQTEVVEIAHQGGIRLVGPNCTGHADLHTKVGCFNAVIGNKPGPMAIVSQSGTVGAGIMRTAGERGIGVSKFISTGNEADLHMEDYVEYLAQDENTSVITGYIEGLRQGRRFFTLAKEITRKKPIVMIKTGSTGDSGRAAKSHTGALAGTDIIYSAAFKQSGVIRVDDDEELCDIVQALLSQPLPRGNRVGILTMGGGFGVLNTEACEREGLRIASLQAPTLTKMDAVLPPRWSHGNPVDVVGLMPTTDEDARTISTCLRALIEDDNVDIVIAPMPRRWDGGPSQNMQAQKNLSTDDVRQLARDLGKTLIFFGGTGPPARDKDSTVEFSHPRRVARALRHLVWYSQYLDRYK
jgi:acetyltransferase